jgi:cbb3-type cytochrome oxidase maturation protein
MSVIILLILASLVVALLFLAGFIWAVRSGQYEDTLTPSMRVLTEDDFSKAGDKAVSLRALPQTQKRQPSNDI